jgi:hypothetical protein
MTTAEAFAYARSRYHMGVAARLVRRAAKNLRRQLEITPELVGIEQRACELDVLERDLLVAMDEEKEVAP